MNVRKKKSLNSLIEQLTKSVIAWEYDSEGCLWTVEQKHDKPEIYCIYFEWNNKKKQWYVADDISEMEGPAALTCPLRFFDLAPEAEFPEWREEVKQYHQGGPPVQEGDVPAKLIEALKKRVN